MDVENDTGQKHFASVESLLYNERYGVLSPRNMIASKNVTPKMRAILVDWIISIHQLFKFRSETFFSCINITDACLSRDPTLERKEVQLLGVTSFLMASKYHELIHADIDDLIYVTNNAYNDKRLLIWKLKSLL